MKNIFLIISLIYFVNLCYSQNIVEEKRSITYTILPLHSLPSNIKSYSVKLTNPGGRGKSGCYDPQIGVLQKTDRVFMKGLYTTRYYWDWLKKEDEYENKYLKIESLQKVANNADIIVELILEPIKQTKYPQSKQLKDSEGHVTSAGDEYEYSCPASLILKTKDGKTLINEKIATESNIYTATYWKTDMYINVPLNTSAFPESIILSNEFITNYYIKAFKVLKELSARKGNIDITIFAASDKKQDYSDLNDALKSMLEGINLYNANDISQAKTKFQTSIGIWEKSLTESSLENRKARINDKVTGILHYNCAWAYLLCDDFENANKHANLIDNFKKSDRYKTQTIEEVADWQKRFEANK